MKPGAHEGDLRIKVLGLKARFALSMTLSLAAVLALTAVLLCLSSASIVKESEQDAISGAVRFTQLKMPHEPPTSGLVHPSGVKMYPFVYDGNHQGLLYRNETTTTDGQTEQFDLWVPDPERGSLEILRTILVAFAAVLVVAVVMSVLVAGSVSRPVEDLIYDVRQIALGNLRHRTKSSGPMELRLLARALDRMTVDLSEAKETEIQLSVRERELELAAGVRDALLPSGTPLIEGYDLGAAFLPSPRFGGDFHDFVQRADGMWGLLVCDVSGRGVPAALVGATARSYLRSELERPGEVADAFRRVNRWLASDVRRGMFVSALYALLDPKTGRATVACAGHKLPLLRLCAADGNLRVVQPEGIALGFDRGPVFERRLQVVEVPIDPGDRLLLANSAPVRIKNETDEELGEKAFYARVKKHGAPDTTQFLRGLRRDLEQYAGSAGFQEDLSFVTLYRNPA